MFSFAIGKTLNSQFNWLQQSFGLWALIMVRMTPSKSCIAVSSCLNLNISELHNQSKHKSFHFPLTLWISDMQKNITLLRKPSFRDFSTEDHNHIFGYRLFKQNSFSTVIFVPINYGWSKKLVLGDGWKDQSCSKSIIWHFHKNNIG